MPRQHLENGRFTKGKSVVDICTPYFQTAEPHESGELRANPNVSRRARRKSGGGAGHPRHLERPEAPEPLIRRIGVAARHPNTRQGDPHRTRRRKRMSHSIPKDALASRCANERAMRPRLRPPRPPRVSIVAQTSQPSAPETVPGRDAHPPLPRPSPPPSQFPRRVRRARHACHPGFSRVRRLDALRRARRGGASQPAAGDARQVREGRLRRHHGRDHRHRHRPPLRHREGSPSDAARE